MEHLHERRLPEWPVEPDGLLRYVSDSRTGGRLTNPESVPAVYRRDEICAAACPPLPASPDDYDASGRALLDQSLYGAWFRSTENTRRDAFALREPVIDVRPRILCPVPGVTYRIDPELPRSGCLLPLRSNLPADIARWSCDTLSGDGPGILVLSPGRHLVRLTDARTGASSETQLIVE